MPDWILEVKSFALLSCYYVPSSDPWRRYERSHPHTNGLNIIIAIFLQKRFDFELYTREIRGAYDKFPDLFCMGI